MSSGVDVTGERCRSAPSQPRPRARGPLGADSRRPAAPPALLPSFRRVPPCPSPRPAGELANGPHVSATHGPGQTYLQPLRVCFLHLKSYLSHKCILLRNQQSNLWSRNEEAPDTSTQHRLPPVTRPFSQVPPETGLGAPSSLFSSMHLHTHNTHTHTTDTYTLHTCRTYYTQHTRYTHHTYTTHPEFVYFINGVHGHPFISSYSTSPCFLSGCPVTWLINPPRNMQVE